MIKLVNDPDLTPDEACPGSHGVPEVCTPLRSRYRNDVDEIRNNIWDNIAIGGMDVEEAVKAGAAQENQLIQQIAVTKKGLAVLLFSSPDQSPRGFTP